jgi:hypothetical protein
LQTEKKAMMPVEVRAQLTNALRLDLVGPGEVLGADGRVLGDASEILPQRPSTWYLTGFLVPLDADPEQKIDEPGTDELDEGGDTQEFDDAVTPDPPAARVRYLPSSIGASLLVSADAKQLTIIARWGDYKVRQDREGEAAPFLWDRTGREEEIVVDLPDKTEQPHEQPVPNAHGLTVAVSVRPVVNDDTEGGLPAGTRSVSVFLVNRRVPQTDELRDQAFVFQTQLDIHGDRPFIPRPDLRSLESDDWDERAADLQYRDAFEFAVGHSVATEAIVNEAHECWSVRTCWIPQAEVEHVAPVNIQGVDLSMECLSQLADAADAQAKLGAFVTQYRDWIDRQRHTIPASPTRRRDIAEELLNRASVATNRHTDTTIASDLVRRFAERFTAYQWPKDRPLPAIFYDPRSLAMPAEKRASLHAKCVVVD